MSPPHSPTNPQSQRSAPSKLLRLISCFRSSPILESGSESSNGGSMGSPVGSMQLVSIVDSFYTFTDGTYGEPQKALLLMDTAAKFKQVRVKDGPTARLEDRLSQQLDLCP